MHTLNQPRVWHLMLQHSMEASESKSKSSMCAQLHRQTPTTISSHYNIRRKLYRSAAASTRSRLHHFKLRTYTANAPPKLVVVVVVDDD